MEENDTTSENGKKETSLSSNRSKKSSSRDNVKSKDRPRCIGHQRSGERAWWMSDDPESVPEGIEVIVVPPTCEASGIEKLKVDRKSSKKIKHIESGERAWWMDSSSNVPEGVIKIPVETSNGTSDSSESFERIDIGVDPEPETYTRRSLSKFPIEFPPPPSYEPLGDRASPEGVRRSRFIHLSFSRDV